jgi:predicted Zn-dependent protease with MMP-like domain
MINLTTERFDQLIGDAVDSFPDEFIAIMNNNNLSITTQDCPTEDQLKGWKIAPNSILLGIHTGTALPRRSVFNLINMPCFIILFKCSIESQCNTEEEVKKLASGVVKHEVAHFFGFTEEQLTAIGKLYKWKQ